MHNLQLQIQQLEAEIAADRYQLLQHKSSLTQYINSAKKRFFLSEILIGGFTFGYLLGPGKKGVHGQGKRRFAGAMVFFQIRKWIKQFTAISKLI